MKKITGILVTCFAFVLGFTQMVFPLTKKDIKSGTGSAETVGMKLDRLEKAKMTPENPTIEKPGSLGENIKFDDLEKEAETED